MPISTTLGPFVIGGIFTVFFFGLNSVQGANYFQAFPRDGLPLKATVSVLCTLEFIYAVCLAQGIYSLTLPTFDPVPLDSLDFKTPIAFNVAILIGSLINHGTQAFFVARIYKVTNKLYISVALWCGVAALQAVSLLLVAKAVRSNSLLTLVESENSVLKGWFLGTAALDMTNAAVLSMYLELQSRFGVTRRTGMVLNQLVLYATNTCITTSVVAGATAICLAISPDTYVWALFFLAMPGSFMTAFLANVNRNFIRPKATRALSSNIGAMHFSANPTLGDDRLGAGSILAVGSMNQAMASRSINDDDELDAVEMEMDKIEPGRNQSFLPF